MIRAAIKQIFSSYRAAEFYDVEGFTAQVMMLLSFYPEITVRFISDVRTGVQRRSTFVPTISEITKACDTHVAYLDRTGPGTPRLPRTGFHTEGLPPRRHPRQVDHDGPYEPGDVLTWAQIEKLGIKPTSAFERSAGFTDPRAYLPVEKFGPAARGELQGGYGPPRPVVAGFHPPPQEFQRQDDEQGRTEAEGDGATAPEREDQTGEGAAASAPASRWVQPDGDESLDSAWALLPEGSDH